VHSGEDGFDHGGLQETRFLPPRDSHFADGVRRSHLAGHSDEDEVRALAVVDRGADDYGRPLLVGQLVGEGEWDEDEVAEFIDGRRPLVSGK